jgi:hypothetical protein
VSTMEEHDGNAVDVTRALPAAASGGPTVVHDGDDIEVLPGGAGPPRGTRNRRIVAGVAIAAVLIIGVGAALAASHGNSSPIVRTTAPTSPATLPPAVIAPRATVPAKKKTTVVVAPTVAPALKPLIIPIGSVPPATHAPVSTVPPPPPAVVTTAPPQQLGPSALIWNANPGSLAITAGGTKALSVTARNPTAAVVSLPHPLSCTPRLDNGEMCSETVQQIGPGQSASATYTIDATGFARGFYDVKIEGVLTVPVTVS